MTKTPDTLPAGTPVTWTQYALDGANLIRTGIVVDRAPTPESKGHGSRRDTPGFVVAYWVHPDEADDRDGYPIIAVAKASSSRSAHGRYVDQAGDQFTTKGGLFASWCPDSPTGKLVADGVKLLLELHS
jgi:hypothetical protein